MLITFPEKVKSQHVATLLGKGYPSAPEGNLYAASMPELWQRDAEGKVVKIDGKGQYAVYDCSTKDKAIAFFRQLVANKQVLGYVHRLLVPGKDGKAVKLFGTPLCNSAAMKALTGHIGFDVTALIAKKG